MDKLETEKKIANKRLPLYVVVPIFLIWTGVLFSCQIIPTHYTTSSEQEALVQQNTLLQIELFKRYESMDQEKREQFMMKNVEFAIAIEEIICGAVKDSAMLFESAKKQKEELKKIKETVKSSDSE